MMVLGRLGRTRFHVLSDILLNKASLGSATFACGPVR